MKLSFLKFITEAPQAPLAPPPAGGTPPNQPPMDAQTPPPADNNMPPADPAMGGEQPPAPPQVKKINITNVWDAIKSALGGEKSSKHPETPKQKDMKSLKK